MRRGPEIIRICDGCIYLQEEWVADSRGDSYVKAYCSAKQREIFNGQAIKVITPDFCPYVEAEKG